MIVNEPAYGRYDVVIIGSGPAGICTAMQVAEQTSATVAIIESGGLQQNEKVQTLSEVEAEGDLKAYNLAMHSQRCFGGTSTIWGGFCARLEERAFRTRAWPIPYRAISRYYPAAADILELPEDVYLRSEVPIEASANIVYRPFYLSPPVRFNKKYRAFIEQHPRIHLILNKTCTRLMKNNGSITEARLADSLRPDQPVLSLRGDQFVAACGGLGNPRLLLLSDVARQMPVGQCFMEHPHLYGVAEMYLDAEKIEAVTEKNANVVHALQLTDKFCLEQGMLSFSADFNLAYRAQVPLLGERRNLIPTPVTVRTEMECLADNRVYLGSEENYLGQPISHVEFNFRYRAQLRDAWQLFAEELVRSGLGRPSTLIPQVAMTGGGHLMGTTRMGRTVADSVVNEYSRVHTVNNLYVAGSSVFPAAGVSNPTYTIVALSLRLGDHLVRVMQGLE